MKISILYFDGCPNHAPTVERVRLLAARHNLDAEVEEIEVTSPDDMEQRRFLGSPTVQVDGLDIEPAARGRTDFAMSCRLYKTPDGLPGVEMLEAAMGLREGSAHREATMPQAPYPLEACCPPATMTGASADLNRSAAGWAGAATAGSVATAMLSSACCWVPLLLLAFGASAAGVSSVFGPWRPVFVVVAVLLLGASGYLNFRGRPAPGACCPPGFARRIRWQRAAWLGSAAVVAAFVFFPQYVGRLVGARDASAASAGAAPIAFTIEGMHCEACATTLTATLSEVDGVTNARVDYASKTATMLLSDEQVVGRVVDVVRRAGFSASANTDSNTP